MNENIVLWIKNEPIQIALANKIHTQFPIRCIVLESGFSRQKVAVSRIFEKLYEKLFLKEIDESWFSLLEKYAAQFPSPPPVKIIEVENINSKKCLEYTKENKADLIVVSGTSLIKKMMFGLKPRIGIINLHTGLSPFIKGGPNCTNWCIANNEFHLIGNTIMWLDEGIDSGNIITTDFVEMSGKETLKELHYLVIEQAHTLYLKAISKLLSSPINYPNNKQSDVAAGKTYFSKMWTLEQKKKMIKNWKNFGNVINTNEFKMKRAGITIYKL
ncbi:MAG: formyltransferase family protein [Bacteroidia bacterium]